MDYGIAVDMILQFMKDAENKSLDMDGKQKKDFVIALIEKNLPNVYKEHHLLLEVIIDTLVLVSNNPTIIKAQSKCINFLCCSK